MYATNPSGHIVPKVKFKFNIFNDFSNITKIQTQIIRPIPLSVWELSFANAGKFSNLRLKF